MKVMCMSYWATMLLCALFVLSACDNDHGEERSKDTGATSDTEDDADASVDIGAEQTDCTVFPEDNPWNTRVDSLPTHPRSAEWIESVGSDGNLHLDFGTVWNGAPNGIPYDVVDSTSDTYTVDFEWPSESDPGPYPIGTSPSIEGGPDGIGDRHIIMVDWESCMLYELFAAKPPETAGGKWSAGSGAIFDLTSNDLRPDYWTSADAAGLPIFPGLVRYEEVVEKRSIEHALRFTAVRTQKAFMHPATHFASSTTDENVPPMGARFRLKADFDISGFSATMQVILKAMKEYGMYLADNGSDWFISGAPNPKWSDDELHEARSIPGSAFEVVDTGEQIVR